MATKPRVHEIFSNQALDRTTNFRYDKQETREKIQLPQKSKKSQAPQPHEGMKKFGGYKPKILGDQEDLIDVQNRAAILAINDSSPPVSKEGKSRPAPHPPVQLTKPKPWVVGDKDVPMVLGGRTRDDWAGQTMDSPTDSGEDGGHLINGPVEVHSHNPDGNGATSSDSVIDDTGIARRSMSESSVVSDTSTLVRSSAVSHEHEGFDNPALGSLDSLAFSDNNNNNSSSKHNLGAINPTFEDVMESAYINGSYTPPIGDSQIDSSLDSDPHLYEEPFTEENGVFIPEPDYGEDEKTLDFTSEDTSDDDAGERRKGEEHGKGVRNGVSPQPGNQFPIPQYEGEDLSHYLSDDEADGIPVSPFDNPIPIPTYNGKAKPKKSGLNPRSKLNQKHSLFKISGSNTDTTQAKGKRKGKSGKSGAPPPAFNSVRNFSYADSKYGTKGRAAGRDIMSVGGLSQSHDRTLSSESEPLDDSDMFLSASNHVSSYESFLRSRHGQSMPTESSDSGVEMADDGAGAGPGVGVWKKLTWRLRNRSSKNYSLAEQ